MNTWFAHCTTSEEIKDEYRRLCKIYHPDVGGDTATMQEINSAYAIASANAIRQEKPDWSEDQYMDAALVAEAIRQAIEEIINLPGLDIEICGLWVWVGGNTWPNRDALKAAGYYWARQKQKWYYPGIPANGRGRMEMDEIRQRYGSQKVYARRQQEEEELLT